MVGAIGGWGGGGFGVDHACAAFAVNARAMIKRGGGRGAREREARRESINRPGSRFAASIAADTAAAAAAVYVRGGCGGFSRVKHVSALRGFHFRCEYNTHFRLPGV